MLTSYSQLRRKLRNPAQLATFAKVGTIATGEHWNSEWASTGIPAAGSAPGASAVPDNTTAGSLGQNNPSGAQDTYAIFCRRFDDGINNGTQNVQFMIADRLVHMGGLSGTVTTAQTVSTSALTRFTSGVDVWAAIEIYTSIGATGTTLTASYTNTLGTAGQTSPAIAIGGTGFSTNRTILPISWARGDLGVKAVSTVTLAGTTGTAGNFGVTLFKTLWIGVCQVNMPYPHRGDRIGGMGFLANVPSGACLQIMHACAGSTGADPMAELGLMET